MGTVRNGNNLYIRKENTKNYLRFPIKSNTKTMFYPKSPFLRYPLVESQICNGNMELMDEITPWLCQTPALTTYRVNLLQTTVEHFKDYLRKLLADRYEVPPLVYTLPDIPEVVCIGRLEDAICQEDHTNVMREVIVDSCCGAALLRGAHLYAPGVVAMEAGTKKHELVRVYADLLGKCKKGTNTRYEVSEKIFIGYGKVHMQRYQLYQPEGPVPGIAVQMQNTISGVPSIGDLSSNEALLQNLPSIVCVRVLGPQSGERVLDMCAAPGNKTTHIAEMMGDCGVVVALDKSETKIHHLLAKLAKNSLCSVRAFAFDSTKAYSANSPCCKDFKPPFAEATFDRIIVDAPCSALGNRPLLSSQMSPKMLQSFPIVQRKLLANAVPLLRSGGTLVYSTCTVTLDENEAMVAWALKKFPELQLVPALPKLGGAGWPTEGLDDQQRQMLQRFGPAHTNSNHSIDTVGFFIAKFIKL